MLDVVECWLKLLKACYWLEVRKSVAPADSVMHALLQQVGVAEWVWPIAMQLIQQTEGYYCAVVV